MTLHGGKALGIRLHGGIQVANHSNDSVRERRLRHFGGRVAEEGRSVIVGLESRHDIWVAVRGVLEHARLGVERVRAAVGAADDTHLPTRKYAAV